MAAQAIQLDGRRQAVSPFWSVIVKLHSDGGWASMPRAYQINDFPRFEVYSAIARVNALLVITTHCEEP